MREFYLRNRRQLLLEKFHYSETFLIFAPSLIQYKEELQQIKRNTNKKKAYKG